MADEKHKQIPDDFWDLSALMPKQKKASPHQKSVETVEVAVGGAKSGEVSSYSPEDTVIHRVISPTRSTSEAQSFLTTETYMCTGSLIHTVTLKKWKCHYQFYDEFVRDALRYHAVKGTEVPYVPYFSYVPQYNQLSRAQKAFYLWWRENCRQGEFLKTTYSYLLLYIFELINLGDLVDVRESQRMLTELWKHYHEEFPAMIGKR